MHCPFCHAEDSRVTDSRLDSEGDRVRRRRECQGCKSRWTTYERAELALPMIVKRSELGTDGVARARREAFDVEKLRRGLLRALEKRPVEADAIENTIDKIIQQLRSSGEREIPARRVGEWLMDALRELDDIAYVRFASVYRRFEAIQDFNDEIARMNEHQPVDNTSD